MSIESSIRRHGIESQDKADRRHNPDWIARQKPCPICNQTIGDAAMYTTTKGCYHHKCVMEHPDQSQL